MIAIVDSAMAATAAVPTTAPQRYAAGPGPAASEGRVVSHVRTAVTTAAPTVTVTAAVSHPSRR